MVVCSMWGASALRGWALGNSPPPGWSLQGALPIKVGMDVWEMLHPKMSGRPVKAGESLIGEACFSWNLLVLARCLR